MRTWIIYKHTSEESNKSYIGLTCRDIKARWMEHIRAAKGDSNNHFHRAIRLYGEHNWKHEVLLDNITTYEEATSFEQYYIKKYRTFEDGYNMNWGGEGNSIKPFHEYPNKRKWYHATKGEMFCTPIELLKYLRKPVVSTGALHDVLKGKKEHYYGWFLSFDKVRNITRPINKGLIITLYHDIYGKFIGTFQEFLKTTNCKSKEFSKLIKGKVRSTKGWRVTEEKVVKTHKPIYKYNTYTQELVRIFDRMCDVSQHISNAERKRVLEELKAGKEVDYYRYVFSYDNDYYGKYDSGDKQIGIYGG